MNWSGLRMRMARETEKRGNWRQIDGIVDSFYSGFPGFTACGCVLTFITDPIFYTPMTYVRFKATERLGTCKCA